LNHLVGERGQASAAHRDWVASHAAIRR